MPFPHVIRRGLDEFSTINHDVVPPTTSAPATAFERFHTDAYDRLFLNRAGQDMRTLPMVRHPATGVKHFNHGQWPVG